MDAKEILKKAKAEILRLRDEKNSVSQEKENLVKEASALREEIKNTKIAMNLVEQDVFIPYNSYEEMMEKVASYRGDENMKKQSSYIPTNSKTASLGTIVDNNKRQRSNNNISNSRQTFEEFLLNSN